MTRRPEIVWRQESSPYSVAYDDIYFSAQDGLAESRAVFLEGNNLPGAWSKRRTFRVAELGFGLARNFCAAASLWRETSTEDQWLSYIGIEASPVFARDIQQALSPWNELSDVVAALTQVYPDASSGRHVLEMPNFRVNLTLFFEDAATAIQKIEEPVDCWFLDGFAPAKNPNLYDSVMIHAVAEHSQPGTTLATYSAASSLRRALEENNFKVKKCPGFGLKRERITAQYQPV